MCGSAGLFEQHKLLFSFSMTVKIQEVEDSLNRDELDFFMKVRVQLLFHTRPSSGITSRTHLTASIATASKALFPLHILCLHIHIEIPF